MPDITMCRNESCELKEKCYRWTATPSRWQSYAKFENSHDEPCRDFVKDYRKIIPDDVDQIESD